MAMKIVLDQVIDNTLLFSDNSQTLLALVSCFWTENNFQNRIFSNDFEEKPYLVRFLPLINPWAIVFVSVLVYPDLKDIIHQEHQ